jgi:hypothetical protein
VEASFAKESLADKRVKTISNDPAPDMKVELPTKDDGSVLLSEPTLPDPFSHSNGNGKINGHAQHHGSANDISYTNGSPEAPKLTKGQKSVRFSPKVEQTTFLQSEPPSPELAATKVIVAEDLPIVTQDREHLQLTMEEAFFLSYGLGVLAVSDGRSKTPISVQNMFSLFRQNSNR